MIFEKKDRLGLATGAAAVEGVPTAGGIPARGVAHPLNRTKHAAASAM